MKTKLLDVLGFILFLLMFIFMLPILIISGAILRPVRYFNYIKAKVNDKEHNKFWY